MRRRLAHVAWAAAVAISSSLTLVACGAGASTASNAADAGCLVPGGNVITVTKSTPPAHLAPGSHVLVMTAAGFTRCLLLYIPQTSVANRPMVLVYHGATDTAAYTASITDFESVANSTGEDVAFLQGYQNTWNDGAGATAAERAHVNDVAFTSVAIGALQKLVAFDHQRIVAAGFSNGALMVQYLGCRLASHLVLIVPVEGQLPTNVSSACTPSRPVSVYEVHGTSDSAIPYWGGTFHGVDGAVITVLSAPKSVQRWAALNGCKPNPLVTQPSRSVQLATFGFCRSGRLVVLRTIFGGVHQWGQNIAQLAANATPAS